MSAGDPGALKRSDGATSISQGAPSPTTPLLAPSGAAPPVGTGFYTVISASNTRSSGLIRHLP